MPLLKLCKRSLFWLILAIPAYQMLWLSSAGCSIILSSGGVQEEEEAAREHNGYYCQCAYEVDDVMDAPEVVEGSDDAYENNSGIVTGLGLTFDTDTIVGVRFANFGVPRGSTIMSARVKFTSDGPGNQAATVEISAENSTNAATFSLIDDISSRDLTEEKVIWQLDPWSNGTEHYTYELTTIIQDLVDRDDWSATSPLVLVFETTAGERTARSLDNGAPPILELTYTEQVAVQLPVCLTSPVDIDDGTIAALESDCEVRVETTFENLLTADACGYAGASEINNVSCKVRPNTPMGEESGDPEDYGFWSSSCDGGCIGEPLDAECTNFDAVQFADCRARELQGCLDGNKTLEECQDDLSVRGCAVNVTATHAGDDEPVCIADGRNDEPQPLSMKIFGRDSTCNVAGTTEISVLDGGTLREPKQDPATVGILDIYGGPCPGGTCPVGFASRLDMDDIKFDVAWSRDPKFEQLTLHGLANQTASVGGQQVASVDRFVAVGRGQKGSDKAAFTNPDGDNSLSLMVDWSNRLCSLEGDLLSDVDAEGIPGTCAEDETVECYFDEDCDGIGDNQEGDGVCIQPEEEDPATIFAVADFQGYLSNQPPTAAAGASQTLECTSPDGADFALSGTASDPDGTDIRWVSWRQGDRTGTEIGTDLSVSGLSLGVGAANDFVLRVVDSRFQADEASTTVSVVDTTPPIISCNTPVTIDPTDASDDKGGKGKKEPEPPPEPVMFTATAVDVCDDELAEPTITAFDCFTFTRNGTRVDKTQGGKEACKVSFDGDTVTISDTGGVDDHITWTVESTDASGNTSQTTCEVVVVNPTES